MEELLRGAPCFPTISVTSKLSVVVGPKRRMFRISKNLQPLGIPWKSKKFFEGLLATFKGSESPFHEFDAAVLGFIEF